MSRSYKKLLFTGIAGGSDKRDKQLNHRATRRKVAVLITKDEFDLATIISDRHLGNVYSFNKDGKKHYYNNDNVDITKIIRK